MCIEYPFFPPMIGLHYQVMWFSYFTGVIMTLLPIILLIGLTQKFIWVFL